MTLTLAGVGYRYAGSRRPSLLDIDLELREGTVLDPARPGQYTLGDYESPFQVIGVVPIIDWRRT